MNNKGTQYLVDLEIRFKYLDSLELSIKKCGIICKNPTEKKGNLAK